MTGPAASFPQHRPPPMGISPVTAWVLDLYGREQGKKPDLPTFVRGLQPSPLFSEAARGRVLEELPQLHYTGQWYRDWLMSEVGPSARAVAAPGPRLPGELTTREAADVLNLHPRTVQKLFDREVLAGRKVGPRKILLDGASVRAYKEMRAA